MTERCKLEDKLNSRGKFAYTHVIEFKKLMCTVHFYKVQQATHKHAANKEVLEKVYP